MNAQELKKLEEDLWKAATELRNASGLKSNEYSTPILGIVFLRFAESVYKKHEDQINKTYEETQKSRIGSGKNIQDIAVSLCGFYIPPLARYDYLLSRQYLRQHKEGESQKEARDAIKEAMRGLEEYNESLKGSLPIAEYEKIPSEVIESLIKTFSEIPLDTEIDIFGHIYEFFLGEFAIGEGQKGGEFFTPPPVVKLIAEVIEPKGGKMLDPACGAGGMFAYNARYVKKHSPQNFNNFIVYGIEKSIETAKLARMNNAINNIRCVILNSNTFEVPEDVFEKGLIEQFDYVCANPPFNVKDVKAKTVEDKTHFNRYGLPKNKGKVKAEEIIPNANYLWISLFATALKPKGRAGLVMANSASDAGGSEYEMRKRLIENGLVSAMLTLSSNMFNTVTLPATLWFFEKGRAKQDEILFVDARNIFTQLSRKQRTFTEEQIQNIATIFRLYRGENHRFEEIIQSYQTQADSFIAPIAEKEDKLQKAIESLQDWQEKVALQSVRVDIQTDDKAREKESKELSKLQKELNKQQKEVESVQAELGALQKQRKYFLDNRKWLTDRFPEGSYQDVTGLCKVASLAEIAEQNYSLNPGRYVGVVIEEDGLTEAEFQAEIKGYHAELQQLNQEAENLARTIQQHLEELF